MLLQKELPKLVIEHCLLKMVVIYPYRMTGQKVIYCMDTFGHKMTWRIVTTARIPVAPALLAETKLDFQRKICQLQSWYSIPDDLIINFDQTPLPYIITGNSTLNEKGTKSVPLQGKGKKEANHRNFHSLNERWLPSNAANIWRKSTPMPAKRYWVSKGIWCDIYPKSLEQWGEK